MTGRVVMTLAAPFQAWGGPAVTAAHRPTDAEPTLSGVTGLIANAAGYSRSDPLDSLTDASLAIRCDRPGRRIRDYHTVGTGAAICRSCGQPTRLNIVRCRRCGGIGHRIDGVPKAKSLDDDNRATNNPAASPNPVTGERWYLSDAAFTVVWTPASDGMAAADVAKALRRPARPLYLGRRSCPPGYPVLLGVTSLPADVVLAALPLLRDPPADTAGDYFADIADAAHRGRLLVRVQHQIETPRPGASARNDVPVTFDPATRWHYHHSRWTVTDSLDLTQAGCAGRGRAAHNTRVETLAKLNADADIAASPT